MESGFARGCRGALGVGSVKCGVLSGKGRAGACSRHAVFPMVSTLDFGEYESGSVFTAPTGKSHGRGAQRMEWDRPGS